MRVVLNVIWFVLAGIWLGIEYLIAGVILCITIIGIPFGIQAFKLGRYAFWPFGRALVRSTTHHGGFLRFIGNVLWIVLAGWWLALSHVIVGCLLCITIIGIPLGIASFKMAGAALAPFGKEIVNTSDLADSADAIAI